MGQTQYFLDGAPVAMAQACVYGTKNCATIDSKGMVTLTDIAANEDYWIEYTATKDSEALFSSITGYNSAEDNSAGAMMPRESTRDLLLQMVGEKFDPKTGIVGFITSGADISASIDAKTANGPYYIHGGVPSTTATLTEQLSGWEDRAARPKRTP